MGERGQLDGERSRQITPVELLGKFYYNRGVELLRNGQFADGTRAAGNEPALTRRSRRPRESGCRAEQLGGRAIARRSATARPRR